MMKLTSMVKLPIQSRTSRSLPLIEIASRLSIIAFTPVTIISSIFLSLVMMNIGFRILRCLFHISPFAATKFKPKMWWRAGDSGRLRTR